MPLRRLGTVHRSCSSISLAYVTLLLLADEMSNYLTLLQVLYFVILSGIIYNSIHNPPKYHTDQRGNIW
jgi:hypothetical protein